jgi:urate oxidase
MLVHNSYGKSQVRLTKVTRHADRHELKELDVSIELEGDFEASYTEGDNSKVIATDSMKNTVYVLARNHSLESIEDFSLSLARHFIERYSQVEKATIRVSESAWHRINVAGKPHRHAFVSGGNEQHTCMAHVPRDGAEIVAAGTDNLLVLKTTDSAFKDFVSDEFRTLADTDDRIFATNVRAHWIYESSQIDWNREFEAARTAILETFATHYSLAVQQTLLAMGEAVLAACPAVERVNLVLPNQHRIPVDLQPFGLDNPNSIFMPTSEPYGLITGSVVRDK